MTQDEIHDRLAEWARWVRGRQVQGHCLSIEWRFRRHIVEGDTPTGWGDWASTPPMPPLPPINAMQALEVERCMRWLPNGHREALRLRYVDRLTHRGMCKRLHLGYDTGERFFEDAQRMIQNRLTFENRGLKIQAQFEHPVQGVTSEAVASGCYG